MDLDTKNTTILNRFQARVTQEIQQNPGFIPIELEPDGKKIIWLDIGDYQLTESVFRISIERLTSMPNQRRAFATDIGVLASDDFIDNTLYPSGFIFHASRCGSTLLSKALARSCHHVVISEAYPHNKSWSILFGSNFSPNELTEENLAIYKNLILATGRKRTPDQRAYFIKFTSWNVLLFHWIRIAFPDVPSIFLYRSPAEVLVSLLRKPDRVFQTKNSAFGGFLTGYPVEETRDMGNLEYLKQVLSRHFAAGLNLPSPNLLCINYNDLNSANFETILKTFDASSSPDQIALMREQFNFYSKDDSGWTPFISDTAEKQARITPEIRNCVEGELAELYQQLEQSESNLTRLLSYTVR